MSRTVLNVVKSAGLNRLGVVQRPSFVTYFVTWACNHRCTFCDVWKKTVGDEMSVDEALAVFRQLGRLDVLRISGGEPFIRKDLAEIINGIERINRPSLIHLTTNGILTDRIVKTLDAVERLEKVHIKVSIDDIGERHDRVRGVNGAYDKAMATVRALAALRPKGLHVGVNQGIVGPDALPAYEQLKAELAPLGVAVYASIAYDSSHTLYSEGSDKTFDPDSTTRPFGRWTTDELTAALAHLADDNRAIGDFKERLVDTYFVNGLYKRMVLGERDRGPRCVALNNHLRLLPNGDVPICLHNGTAVGNLRTTRFDDLWFGEAIRPHRQWVADCSGCWVSCETAVSAIYTGDIWKGLRKTAVTR